MFLIRYLQTKENLSTLTFEEISKYIDVNSIKENIKKDYWILSGQEEYKEEIIILDKKESF